MTSVPVPNGFSRTDLEQVGFVGWQSWDELRVADFPVPPTSLCYVVFRPASERPAFLAQSPGGRFKGKDPTVAIDTLEAKWVDGAHVVNVGKADVGRRRLKSYARFGAGEPVAHWGGRYIWQLSDSQSLLVAWHEVTWRESARDYERRLSSHFRQLHGGRLPFANLTS